MAQQKERTTPPAADRIVVERVQTGLRIEKRILKVLKGVAEYLDMTLGDLVEGIVLHAFEGKAPFGEETLKAIADLKKVYRLDLDATASHRLSETGRGDERSQPTTAHARGRRVVRSYTQQIEASPEQVFPLLCPVREADWLDGWRYDLVYSASGVAEKGCVFTTGKPGEDRPVDVWIVSTHDSAAGVVEFSRVSGDAYTAQIRIALSAAGEGTRAEISYAFTALSEAGSRMIDTFHDAESFHHMVTFWERSMNHFLRTGERLVGSA